LKINKKIFIVARVFLFLYYPRVRQKREDSFGDDQKLLCSTYILTHPKKESRKDPGGSQTVGDTPERTRQATKKNSTREAQPKYYQDIDNTI
jgi:hypothetical protein